MSVPRPPLAIDLKEILRRALDSKIRRAQLVVKRAASIAMTEPGADLSDSDRALLETIIQGDLGDGWQVGGGRSLRFVLQDKYLDRLVSGWSRVEAEKAIRSEEAIRLRTNSGKPTAWELTFELVREAIANRTVGYFDPKIRDKLLDELCWNLALGKPVDWEDGEEHLAALQREGFARELLAKLWEQCPGEAAEMKLPRLDGAMRSPESGAPPTPLSSGAAARDEKRAVRDWSMIREWAERIVRSPHNHSTTEISPEKAKKQFIEVLDDLDIWLDEARDDTFTEELFDYSIRAAELAAILGFTRPPFEHIIEVPHEVYNALTDTRERARYTRIRVHAPEGMSTCEFGFLDPLGGELILECSERIHHEIAARIRRWKRVVERIDPATVKPATVAFGTDKESLEAVCFDTQRERALAGDSASFVDDFMQKIGEGFRLSQLYGFSPKQTQELLLEAGRASAEAEFNAKQRAGAAGGTTVEGDNPPTGTLRTDDDDVVDEPAVGPPENQTEAPKVKASPPPIEGLYLFRLRGNVWELRFADERGNFSDRKGLHILSRLLRFPEETVRATELQGLDPRAGTSTESVQAILDDEAKSRCRDRLAEMDREIEEAERNGDDATLPRLQTEKEQLVTELGTQLGLAGKSRNLGPRSPTESARVAVRQNLDRVFGGLRTAQPPMTRLADHLERSILNEGNAYAYRPESCPAWEFG